MTDYPANNGTEGLEATDSSGRRLDTDIAQPLDYVAEECTGEQIEKQQRAQPRQKTLIKKLFNKD